MESTLPKYLARKRSKVCWLAYCGHTLGSISMAVNLPIKAVQRIIAAQ